MAGRRRKQSFQITMKHVMTLVALLAVLLVFVFGISQKQNRLVSKINVNITSLDEGKPIIKADDIFAIIESHAGFDIERASLKDFDIISLEEKLNTDKRIGFANVYFGKNGNMFVDVKQRQPIVRVTVTGGDDYYLDKEGKKIPVNESSILRLPIATGAIDTYVNDYEDQLGNNLNQIYTIASQVENDPFLKSLIEQINVEEDGTFVMVPKLGRNKIILGNETALDEKLNKLKIYYKEGIKRVGLDRFSEINLSYEGHIVGIK